MTKPMTKEELNLLNSLLGRAKDEGIDVFALEDFSSTLEAVIREELAALDEPVFTNPTTGQPPPRYTSW